LVAVLWKANHLTLRLLLSSIRGHDLWLDSDLLLVSLTLSPALCAVLFKAHQAHEHAHAGPARRLLYAAFDRFNLGFDQLSLGYGNLTRRLVRGTVIVLAGYAGLIGVAGRLHFSRETGLLPTGDVPKRND
jgi:multidrug efflux pump subunit AcrB